MKKQDEGFTLIELLIVIVILGILAAVVVFAVGGITDRGQESACDADFKTLEVAYEAYVAQWGTASAPDETDLVSGGFMRSDSDLMNISGSDVVIQSADCTDGNSVGDVYVTN
jgi:general secretion pathway protein G